MNYILGLDIGIASVGWAAIALDANDEPRKILDLNARIFKAAEQPKTGASLAAPRREARSSRRRTRRRRHRMERLRHLFAREGLITADEMKTLFSAPADVYRLRAEGLARRLEKEEWARVLYHIAKHRGFRSNRKAVASDADEGKVISAVKENAALLKKYKSVGDMLFRDEKFQAAKRNKGGSYAFCVSRDMLLEEIGALFSAQRANGNPHASEDFEDAYRTIFASQRNFDDGPDINSPSPYAGNQIEKMIGSCSLEPSEKRAPKASYSFMRFSLLQKLSHLRLKTTKGEERSLTAEEKDKVEDLAWRSASFSYAAIRKALSLPEEWRFTDLYYRWGKEPKEIEKKKLPFTDAYHEIRKVLDKREKDRIKALSPDQLDAIGYIFTVFKNDVKIEAGLKAAGIDEEDTALLMASGRMKFRGFGHISARACRKLIPHLEKGLTYDKACIEAGYGDREAKGEKTTCLSGSLPEIQEIPNPVVRRAVSQTVKVINAVIRRYGSPVAVNVELAREMGRSFKDRREIMKSMEDNNARNEKLKEELKGYGVLHPTGQDIVKLRLYKEQSGICAYSLAVMPIGKVLTDPSYAEVDHILPYSRSFDDSYANKVLVLAKENRDKGNRTPMEYMENKPGRRHDFITWVKNSVKDYRKRENLLLEKFDEDREAAWKERHLTDTQYISRLVANLLRDHLTFAPWLNGKKRHVMAVSGAVTSYMRKRLGIRKIREDGDLHHAVDAAVIATVPQGNIQKLTNDSKTIERAYIKNANGSYTDPETGEILKKADLIQRMSARFPEPWPGFRQELEARVSDHPKEMISSLRLPAYAPEEIDALRAPFVSRMPTRKVHGAAHQETVFSPRHIDQGLILKKVFLESLKLNKTKDAIEDYYEPESDRLLHEALLRRLKDFGGDGKKAFAAPFYKPKANGEPGPLVKKVKIAKKITLSVPVHQGRGLAANDNNGGMVRVDIFYTPEGKGQGYYLVPVYTSDVVRAALPMRGAVAHKPYDKWKEMKPEEFLFSLYPNDLVYIKSRKAFKGKLSDKQAKNSTLPAEKEETENFFYYKGCDIDSASISVVAIDGVYSFRGFPFKTLLQLEKWTVGVLGDELHPIRREVRQGFDAVKTDFQP